MNLFETKLHTECIIKELNIEDEITKIRLMELGLITGTKITVKHKSIFKKTLLISFNSTCFTVGENVGKSIVVSYA